MMHSDLSMQKEFDIKRKSHDISGSASLALWANMNQSTTQLGSKRQSQGKHPLSNNRHLYMLCSHHLPSQYILFCKFFSFSVILCGFIYIYIFSTFSLFLFFFIVHFPPRWFSCLQPSCPPSEFVWSLCDALLYCMSSRGHTLCHWMFIGMDFFPDHLLLKLLSNNMSNLCTFLPVGLQQIIDISRVKTLC